MLMAMTKLCGKMFMYILNFVCQAWYFPCFRGSCDVPVAVICKKTMKNYVYFSTD